MEEMEDPSPEILKRDENTELEEWETTLGSIVDQRLNNPVKDSLGDLVSAAQGYLGLITRIRKPAKQVPTRQNAPPRRHHKSPARTRGGWRSNGVEGYERDRGGDGEEGGGEGEGGEEEREREDNPPNDAPPELARYESLPVGISRREKKRMGKHNSWSCENGGSADDRASPPVGPPDMDWICLPYYLVHGYIQMTFVNDKSHDMSNLTGQQKASMLLLLALSVCNFLSTTTTRTSPLLFLVTRSVCDGLNILHSIILLLVSIWTPRLVGDHAAFYRWLADFPSVAELTGQPGDHVGAYLGTASLLLGLVRVSSDLKIDVHPHIRELPVVVTGLLLMLLPAANVVHRTSRLPPEGIATDGAGGGVGASVLRESKWCSSQVLTSALVLGLVDMGAPPQRSLGAPLVAMVMTSVWCIAVAAAGILFGPDALPWPGMWFFVMLGVACLLLSKHI